MLRFNILPTDERFAALTDEQIEGLWMAHLKALKGRDDDGEVEFEDSSFDQELASGAAAPPSTEPRPPDISDFDDPAKWKTVA